MHGIRNHSPNAKPSQKSKDRVSEPLPALSQSQAQATSHLFHTSRNTDRSDRISCHLLNCTALSVGSNPVVALSAGMMANIDILVAIDLPRLENPSSREVN